MRIEPRIQDTLIVAPPPHPPPRPTHTHPPLPSLANAKGMKRPPTAISYISLGHLNIVTDLKITTCTRQRDPGINDARRAAATARLRCRTHWVTRPRIRMRDGMRPSHKIYPAPTGNTIPLEQLPWSFHVDSKQTETIRDQRDRGRFAQMENAFSTSPGRRTWCCASVPQIRFNNRYIHYSPQASEK